MVSANCWPGGSRNVGGPPPFEVLWSLLGAGVRIGARTLTEVGDGSTFPTAAHLAVYAGPAPRPAVQGPRSPANNLQEREQEAQTSPLPSCSPPWATGIETLLRQEDRPGQAPHLRSAPSLKRPAEVCSPCSELASSRPRTTATQ
ncbi:transposase [Streptomyces sp. NPDC102487]|uniref:transposase n=1 Tax=Streptomyces sp. NPDC102487 TaxID=3366182 RepID=UPI00382A0113